MWRATAGFIVTSFLDCLMTCSLLSSQANGCGMEFVEGNPVAGYF
jgi:hypothetical protein